MNKWGKFRFILFSALLTTVLFSGIYAQEYQARPLNTRNVSLTVSADPTIYSEVGQTITYTYTIKNESLRSPEYTRNIIEFYITDDLIGKITCQNRNISIAEQKSKTCTATYTITQEDIDAGSVTNHVKAHATLHERDSSNRCGCGCAPQQIKNDFSFNRNDSVTITFYNPEIELDKVGEPATFSGAGEEINYLYIITNTGTEDLEGPITITDDMLEVSCPEGGLDVGQEMECSASYTTTENDLANGYIENTAIATSGEVSSNEASFIVEYLVPPVTLTKTGKVHIYSIAQDLLSYVFTITNNGSETVSGPFEFNDPMLDQLVCDFPSSLGPGGSYQCEGYYRVRESELGKPVNNCASITYTYHGVKAQSESCFVVEYQPAEPDPKKEGGGDDYPDPDA